MSKSFGEVLSSFKLAENAISIAPLIDDKELICGLAAWQSVSILHKEVKTCEETDPFKKWLWLWNQIELDLDTFATVANVNCQEAEPLFTRLKGLRLIYPDGTIHNLAKQFIQALVLSKLPKAKQKKEVIEETKKTD